MRNLRILPILACLATALACSGKETGEEGGPPPEKAVRAAAIADALAQAPADRVDAILAEHGMTAESFRDLMEEIAGDPVLTKAYEGARKTR